MASITATVFTITFQGALGGQPIPTIVATNLTLAPVAAAVSAAITTAVSFADGTTINGGIVNLGSASALGTGGIVINGGTLETSVAGGLSISAIRSRLNNSVLSMAGSNSITFSGAATFGGLNNSVAVNGTGNLIFTGEAIGSGGLTKSGSGTMILAGAGTFLGLTVVNAGILNVQNATALGTLTLGTIVNSGATLAVQGGINSAEVIAVSGTGVGGNGDDSTVRRRPASSRPATIRSPARSRWSATQRSVSTPAFCP